MDIRYTIHHINLAKLIKMLSFITSSASYKKELTPASVVSFSTLPKELCIKKDTFEELWSMRPKEEQYVRIGDSMVTIPRKQKAYGISYTFSGQTAIADPVPAILQPYLDYANSASSAGNNMILVNWYIDGNEYIGFHADDETQIVSDSNIYIISFGAERTLRFKENATGRNTDFVLPTNSVLTMGGTCQKTHKHSLLKSCKVHNRRISLTIRSFITRSAP
jgi:alkylated DNA repair dioxygenase AlkB